MGPTIAYSPDKERNKTRSLYRYFPKLAVFAYFVVKIDEVNKIYHFLNTRWAMAANDYARLLMTVMPALKNGQIDTVARYLEAKQMVVYATTPYLADRYELDDATLPDGSVAVICLDGPLFSWETLNLERRLQQAADNSKIVGVVLWINGPGGMISRVDVVADMITNYPKPIATYVAGTMASAHFWIGVSAGRTFVDSRLSEVGSVGVMITFQSLKRYFSEQGIDIRAIYPDAADLKNKWFRDIEDNDDETTIKERLTLDHRIFCEHVAKSLNMDYDPDMALFRGETFTGTEAVEKGYIDEIGNLQDAVRWVVATATAKETNKIIDF